MTWTSSSRRLPPAASAAVLLASAVLLSATSPASAASYHDGEDEAGDWGGYLDCIGGLDQRVGEILDRLDAGGLADDNRRAFSLH